MSNIKIMNKGEKYAHATIGCIKGFEGKQFMNCLLYTSPSPRDTR